MPRVIVIAEGLVDHRSQPRHQTVFSEQASVFNEQLAARIEQAVANAAALEADPPAQPIPAGLARRVQAIRAHPTFRSQPQGAA